jgi:hypothetical protein
MVVLPTRIFNNTCAQFEIRKDYFGINSLQCTYFTLSGEDILKCRGEDITICPANQAIYSTDVNSRALSLYLQSSQLREMCKRTVITSPAPPKLERHGSVVLYYLAEPQRLHLQCQRNRSWETHTMTLEGGGVLQNIGFCYFTLRGLQLYPSLEREAEFSARGPAFFTPTLDGSSAADVTSKWDKYGAVFNQHFQPPR